MINKKEKFYILYFSVFLIALLVFILGTIFKPRDVLMRETNDYLYYKEYTLFGLDSACYKYHKPIEYDGVISDKSKSSHFVGVPGKGGHAVVVYRTTVSYDGRTYKYDGSWVYDHYEKGDKVIVTETFYPKYKIDFKHK